MVEGSMKEVEVSSLGLDKSSNTPVVILQESDGERMLPIWIGPSEASAIAMELAGIKFSRPLTHDLFTTVVSGLGSELVRVLITKVEDNTYYASLVLEKEGEMISVDARPSDSIALALRAEAPVFADESLLELTSLEVEEADLDEPEPWQESADAGPDLGGSPGGEPSVPGAEAEEEEEDEPSEPLKDYLKRMNPEDFGRFEP
ncbi:MAG: bifunctional nuclease family protein [Candidatus Palauibacterales bacterium]|nr:bifunctional nuclease family protein [Candidatus Palauibacterales bacterium]